MPQSEITTEKGNVCGVDLFGGTLFRTFARVLPIERLDALEKFISQYGTQLATAVSDCRGEHIASYLGSWTPSGGKDAAKIYHTPATHSELASLFINQFQDLFELISSLLQHHYPAQANILQQVVKEHRLFGLFSLLILNYICGNDFHTDTKDWKNGFCAVFPFGEFSDGNLQFPDLKTTVELKKGDVIFFQSFNLLHGSELSKGTRRSIVLCTHNTVINRSKLNNQ